MVPRIYHIVANLTVWDWFFILIYFLFTLLVGFYFTRRATTNIVQYFTSGRGMPWWLLGTSMVATSFAADTPLAISGLIVKQGIAGNWYWWCMVPIHVMGAYFFARLWQRAGVLTDTELVKIRYSGKPAKILRGFRALYFSLPYNCLVMGWVNLAMANILGMTFKFNKLTSVLICFFFTMTYSAISGLWGVMVTDFFQFFLAMGMAILLSIYTINHIGGMEVILERLAAVYGDASKTMVSIFPHDSPLPPLYNQLLLPTSLFLLYIGMVWWTTGNTDGGAYLAQRMLSAKNEKHSFLGYLWFSIAHYSLRPWPWIIVGLGAAVMFPGIGQMNPSGKIVPNPELGYVAVMLTLLPKGLLGLMLASFFAAYMSTISTQLNWGASYLVNDFYKAFIKKNASNKHYVFVSIAATVLIALVAAIVTFFLSDIFTAWLILSAINAGIGVVYIARWYWWRVNAWSEISAILACLVSFVIVYYFVNPRIFNPDTTATVIKFPVTLIFTVPFSLLTWLTVTFLTPPTDEAQLIEFYRRVQPGGIGWRHIANKITDKLNLQVTMTRKNLLNALISVIAIYSILIATGKLILGSTLIGILLLGSAGLCTIVLYFRLSQEKW